MKGAPAEVSWVVTDNALTDVQPNWSPYAYLYAAAPPDAPPSPRLVAGSRTRTVCTIEWDAPTSTGGIPLTGFILYRNEGLGTSVTTILWNGVSQPNVRQMQVSGLTPGIEYTFEVRGCFSQSGMLKQASISTISHISVLRNLIVPFRF